MRAWKVQQFGLPAELLTLDEECRRVQNRVRGQVKGTGGSRRQGHRPGEGARCDCRRAARKSGVLPQAWGPTR